MDIRLLLKSVFVWLVGLLMLWCCFLRDGNWGDWSDWGCYSNWCSLWYRDGCWSWPWSCENLSCGLLNGCLLNCDRWLLDILLLHIEWLSWSSGWLRGQNGCCWLDSDGCLLCRNGWDHRLWLNGSQGNLLRLDLWNSFSGNFRLNYRLDLYSCLLDGLYWNLDCWFSYLFNCRLLLFLLLGFLISCFLSLLGGLCLCLGLYLCHLLSSKLSLSLDWSHWLFRWSWRGNRSSRSSYGRSSLWGRSSFIS